MNGQQQQEEEEAAGEAMASSSEEFVGTEDALRALIDHLVYPLLPINVSSTTPTLSDQQSVAKQIHAVVLLYNYYHRKQFPQLEFLGVESFCKVASIVKQSLLVFMRFMHRSEEESCILEKQLSVTEEMVLDACNICTGLGISENCISRRGWPVSKVAVLLVDPTRKNCLLQFSSLTQGIWSLIEKDVGTSFGDQIATPLINITCKKRQSVNKPSRDGFLPNEDTFLQLALSAVKEKAGINSADLTVLERDVAYSLSQEKTTACFYLMQYKQAIIKEDVAEFSIKDVMDSLQGPLVRKDLTVTPVVEYFHLLPYIDILSGWLSRQNLSDWLSSPGNGESGALELEIVSLPDGLSSSPGEQADMGGSGCLEPEKSPCTQDSEDEHLRKRKRVSSQISPAVPKVDFKDKAEMVDSMKKPCDTEHKDARLLAGKDSCNAGFPVHDERPVVGLPLAQINVQNSDKLRVITESKRGSQEMPTGR